MPEFSDYLEAQTPGSTPTGAELLGSSQGGAPRSLTTQQVGGINFRGAYDLSVNAYPSSGGTGTGGVPAPGNMWYVSVPGSVDVFGLGVITLERGATLLYIGGTVTSPNSWVVKQ